MSESNLDKLTRFTPSAESLDRDGLLFAAGRASAPKRRPWVTLAGFLTVSQVVTLVLLWPRAPEPIAPSTPALAPTVIPAPPPESPSDPPSGPPPLLALRRFSEEEWVSLRKTEQGEMVPQDPPWRAFPLDAQDLFD